MYRLDKYRLKVEVKLSPGFYILQNESSSGKTYLAKALYEYMGYGEPVGSYTYANFLANEPLIPKLADELKLFIFDRFDMFYSKLSDDELSRMKEVSKFAVIIADLKGRINLDGPIPKKAHIRYKTKDYILIGGW